MDVSINHNNKEKLIKSFSTLLIVIGLCISHSCKKELDAYPLLTGHWIEYKKHTYSGQTHWDSLMALDPASDTVKKHLEFYKGGKVKEWYHGGEPTKKYPYKIQDSIIVVNDITRIIIRKVTEDELVLIQVDLHAEIGVDFPSEYTMIEYFRRVN